MAFKIVQTIENSLPKLSVVPTLWEKNGVLYWPPKNVKYAKKCIMDINSRPGPEWKKYKCVLKRNYIPTYEDAIKELSVMEQNTDTDNENCSAMRTSIPDSAQLDDHVINFEEMAQDLMAQNLDNSQSSARENCTLSANVSQQDTIQVINSEDIQTLISNQAAMLAKLDVVVENQKKLALKMASLSVQLEETKASISQENERPVNVTLLQDQVRMTEENESFCIRPVENQQQLEMLEINLADKIQKKNFSKSLSLLCSSSVGSGTTCAYKLLDVFFTRDFLCQCSWTGGSKGEVSKIPLKNYKNLRNFFFELVNSWDPNFTDDDAENFLKLVLRNATKRKSMKGLRQSSKRTRKSINRGNSVNSGEQLHDEDLQAIDEDNGINRKEYQASDERYANNRNKYQAGENRQSLEDDDNNEASLC